MIVTAGEDLGSMTFDLVSLRHIKAHKRQKSPQALLLENIAISDLDTGSSPV